MESSSTLDFCQLIQQFQEAYQALADEESREIYRAFYLSLLTQNDNPITKSISHSIERRVGAGLLELLAAQKQAGKKVVIFCCGALGRHTNAHLSQMHVKIDLFCDNKESYWGTRVQDIPVISPKELAGLVGHAFVLISTNVLAYLNPIENQLQTLGFSKNDFLSSHAFGEMYFPKELFRLAPGEVFADCGAYNGDESLTLIQKTDGKYRKIYLVEPDEKNMKQCQHALRNYTDIDFLKACVLDYAGEIGFSFAGHQGSQVYAAGERKTPCITMDDYMMDMPPTFIKMDLEGTELQALRGAAQLIRLHHPKLAVSIYHRPEDIFTLPAFLNSLYPQYRFYLRHHSFSRLDTVLYALP